MYSDCFVNMSRLDILNFYIRICCSLGFVLSYYSYYVETRIEHDKNYSPVCDISEHISCSVAFSSEYAKGFGVAGRILGKESILNQPNGLIGCLFYLKHFVLSFIDKRAATAVMIGFAGLSNLMSCYLAYILYFILNDACIVCISTYVVNAVLLWLATLKMQSYQQIKEKLG